LELFSFHLGFDFLDGSQADQHLSRFEKEEARGESNSQKQTTNQVKKNPTDVVVLVNNTMIIVWRIVCAILLLHHSVLVAV
jgi:hypothetical protein